MSKRELLRFVAEREAIRQLKEPDAPGPWTEDPILAKYRFCNVRRNDDAQTRLIHKGWLNKSKDKDMWFAMCTARLVNWWPSLADMDFPLPWNPDNFVSVLERRSSAGEKAFTGAYMINSIGADAYPSRAAYLADRVLGPLWCDRENLRPCKGDALEDFHSRLSRYRGMGSFMAAQVVADVKYHKGGHLARAYDFNTWAASGPGSRRGLSRVLGLPVKHPWTESTWRARFAELWVAVEEQLQRIAPGATAQDLQNCLCEFDKYERARLGEGAPKQLYHPQQGEV